MTHRHLDHVELWSGWPFQSGASRLTLLTGIVSMSDTWRIGGEGSTTVRMVRGDSDAPEGTALRVAADSYALAVPGRVLVFVFDDYSRLVRRIVDRTDGTDDHGIATLELLGLSVSLAKTPPVQLGSLFRFDGVGLSASQHLSAYILPAAEAGGLDFVVAGEIIPTGIRDIAYDGDTAWSALQKLAEAFDAELSLRWDYTNFQVLIDLLPSDGSVRIDESYDRGSDGRLTVTGGALVTSSTFGDHIADPVGVRLEVGHNAAITRVLSEKERATRVVGMFGDGSTIAEALWVVTAIDGSDVTLADLGGGPGPILVDDQLNGLYLEAADRVTRVEITDSVAATQEVTVTSASAVSVGDRIRIRSDASGGKVLSLTDPAELSSGGDIVRVIRRDDIAAAVNLVENPDQSIWTGGTSAPADAWAAVGSPTIARNSTAAHIETGSYSCRVEAGADGEGLATPLTPVSPEENAPYVSGFVNFKLVSGAVRVEMVATDGVDSWVFPDGVSQEAVTTLTGVFVKAGVAGIDLSAFGITAVRMRLVQHGDTPATFYVDAAQVTESAGQQPLVIGAGPTQGWQAVNAELAVSAPIRAQYTGDVLDFHRLDRERYPWQELVSGALHTIVDPGLGIVDGVRLLEVTRSGESHLKTRVTLSSLASDLRSLRGRQQPRRITAAGSGSRVTPAASGARTIHVSISASDTALASSDAAFVATDVGQVLWVLGAGTGGAILKTTISDVTDTSNATTSGAAATAVTDAVAFLGTSEGVLTLAAGQGSGGGGPTDAAERDQALTQASIRELARRMQEIEAEFADGGSGEPGPAGPPGNSYAPVMVEGAVYASPGVAGTTFLTAPAIGVVLRVMCHPPGAVEILGSEGAATPELSVAEGSSTAVIPAGLVANRDSTRTDTWYLSVTPTSSAYDSAGSAALTTGLVVGTLNGQDFSNPGTSGASSWFCSGSIEDGYQFIEETYVIGRVDSGVTMDADLPLVPNGITLPLAATEITLGAVLVRYVGGEETASLHLGLWWDAFELGPSITAELTQTWNSGDGIREYTLSLAWTSGSDVRTQVATDTVQISGTGDIGMRAVFTRNAEDDYDLAVSIGTDFTVAAGSGDYNELTINTALLTVSATGVTVSNVDHSIPGLRGIDMVPGSFGPPMYLTEFFVGWTSDAEEGDTTVSAEVMPVYWVAPPEGEDGGS